VTLVVATDIPSQSLLDPVSVKTAYFADSYRIALSDGAMPMPAIFFAIFGHHPLWIKILLLIRNRIAAMSGLDVASDELILRPAQKAQYKSGDTIGPWPIYTLMEHELIAGRDNAHLDFRLSVIKSALDGRNVVTVSTICNVHNIYGKLYLCVIVPFHKWGLRRLLAAAVRSGRL
jgi:Protein of unknown function (DUF2867)